MVAPISTVQLTAAAADRADDSVTASVPGAALARALGAVGVDVPHAAVHNPTTEAIRIRRVTVIESSFGCERDAESVATREPAPG